MTSRTTFCNTTSRLLPSSWRCKQRSVQEKGRKPKNSEKKDAAVQQPEGDILKQQPAQQAENQNQLEDQNQLENQNQQPPATEEILVLDDSPIVIVPEGDRITIASSDHAALDQMEDLLRTLSRSDSDSGFGSTGSDFAVFLLRNTGATDMRQLLGELFEQLRKNNSGFEGFGGRGSNFGGGFMGFGPSFGDVAVVGR